MQAKITKTLIDELQPHPDKDIWVWDMSLKGFGMRVTPTGSRTYWVQYRMGGRTTPTRRLKIGRHGSPWTPAEARAHAEQVLALVTQGRDPVAEAKAAQARLFDVADLANRYVTQHLKPKNKPSTQAENQRIIEKIIKPKIGKRPIAEITRGEISKLHHELAGTPRQANLTLSILSKMFSLSEVWGFRPDGSNPCRLVERYKETSRERFLSNTEVMALGKALFDAEGLIPEAACNAIKLLLLTGCRLSEALALQWTDVDIEASSLTIRDAKAGARVHAIGGPALAMLADLPRLSKWVLPGVRNPQKPLSSNTLEGAWQRLRTAAGLDGVRLHDLRHTVGTYASQAGANAFLVRDKLGHKTLTMTGRYVSRDADPLRQLSDKVESRIASALEAGKDYKPGEIVKMPSKRRRNR